MKKLLIGAVVGGILLFIWQFLSWTVLDLHYNAYQYTDKQDAIMSSLNSLIDKDGQYMVPSLPRDATREQHEEAMKTMAYEIAEELGDEPDDDYAYETTARQVEP